MAIIPWGRPKIEFAKSVNGVPSGAWTQIDTPKEDTTELTTTQGDRQEATEEGGAVVDVRYGANSYQLVFTLFAKKGKTKPIPDSNGVIEGNYAWRITPEDPACEGLLIENSTVSVQDAYTPADGKTWIYTVEVLKPASGDMLKPYAGSTLAADPTALYFDGAADDTGKTVTVTATGTVTASSADTWITPSVSGQTVTVKVAQNNGDEPRTGYVALSADDKSCTLKVVQIPDDSQ